MIVEMSKRIDAVVLGSGLNSLGIVRSIGASGQRVALVSHGSAGIAAASRYVSVSIVLTDSDFDPKLIAEQPGNLRGVGASGRNEKRCRVLYEFSIPEQVALIPGQQSQHAAKEG